MLYKMAILLVCICTGNNLIHAQQITGVYSLTGIPEMAAAFEFKADGSFRFMYSYGAVDRTSVGTYTQQNNTIILKANKVPGKDFIVNKQSMLGKQFSIKVVHPNAYLTEHISCVAFSGEKRNVYYTNKQGLAVFDTVGITKVYLQHPLYPDVLTLIKDADNKNNHFELSLSPLLEQVSFKGIDLTINGNTLTCLPNYFMPFENIKFVREN
jgi:hypothetical protein